MFESILYLILIYLYLSFLGAGPYLLLAPTWLRRIHYLPFVVPVLGSSVLSVLAMYVIRFRFHVAALIPITLIAASLLLLTGLLLHRRDVCRIWSELRKMRPRIGQGTITLLMAILVVVALLWPAVRDGSPTVPFRVGPDQMGNVVLAQFFLAGGTINNPNEIDRFRKDIWIPKEAINGMRWSFPAALATYDGLTGSPHTYRVAFPAIALHLMLLGGLVYCLLFYRFGLSPLASLLGGAAVTFNCNMLNAICEGFWAQVFIMPMSVVMLMVLLYLRDTEITKPRSDVWRSVFLLSLLTLPLATAWAEGTQIFLYFWLIMMILDLVFKRKVSKTNLVVVLAAIITLLLAAPVLPMLKRHYINVLHFYLRVSGFPQPQWALPSEILGLSNIYHNFMSWFRPDFSPKLGHRSAGSLVFNLIASGLIVVAFVRHIFVSRSLDKPFWLTAPVFVLVILFTTQLSGRHNFMYMKSYVLFLPFLFTGFYGSPPFSRRFQALYKGAKYAISIGIIVVGLSYVHEYSISSTYVTNDMFELYTYSHRTDLSNVVFITRGPVGLPPKQRWQQFMLDLTICPLFAANILDQWVVLNPDYQEQRFNRHFKNHVYLLLRKSDLPSWPYTEQKTVQRIIWQNHTFVIMDTGRLFQDAFSNESSEPNLKIFWETVQPSPLNPRASL